MVFIKGQTKTGGKKKGTKNKLTLLKEERRAIFDEEVSKDWINTIKALRPEYIANQFIGKAPDRIEADVKIKLIKLDE